MLSKNGKNNIEIEEIERLQKSSLYFVEKMWGLVPQPVKEEFRKELYRIIALTGNKWEEEKQLIRPSWFGPFVKGQHITWQQYLLFLSIDKAVRDEASRKVSIASGHGIGKSSSIALLILWFLFCHIDAQVPCTAPTSDQMYDVLWKELMVWINKMKYEEIKSLYVWESTHVRIKESPETWFARAKTASKENSEALAGVHGDHVMLVVDEASGVPEQIFNTAEGALTNDNVLVVLISNPTRSDGYFYDTHHKDRGSWQCLVFDSEESPIVDKDYVKRMEERHGRDSTEFGIRVKGIFPRSDVADDKGYVPLIFEQQITVCPPFNLFTGRRVLAVDPSGEGQDTTRWVVRDRLRAKVVLTERTSNPRSIAQKTLTLMDLYKVAPEDTVVENFGVGADVGKEIAITTQGKVNVYTVNTGEPCDTPEDKELYINKRAEMYYKGRKWLIGGGMIEESKAFMDQITSIRYRRNLQGKIQIMPKEEMKKVYGLDSPDIGDAFALTFLVDIEGLSHEERIERELEERDSDEERGISGEDLLKKYDIW